MLTESGKAKLTALLTTLEAIQAREFAAGRNLSSSAMVKSAIELINLILPITKVSEVGASQRKRLRELTNILDNHTGTFVLHVFNEESLALATALLAMLKDQAFSATADTTIADHPLIKTLFGNVERFVQQMMASLDFQINFFGCFKRGMDDKASYAALDQRLSELQDTLLEQQKTGIAPDQLYATYQAKMADILHASASLAYLRVANPLLNIEGSIALDDYVLVGCQGRFIRVLLQMEEWCMQQGLFKGVSVEEPLVLSHYQAINSEPQRQAFAAQFAALLQQVKALCCDYLGGSGLNFFQRLQADKGKRAVIQELLDQVDTMITGDDASVGYNANALLNAILMCIRKNAAIVKHKNISPGRSHVLLVKAFMLVSSSIASINAQNDLALHTALAEHAATLQKIAAATTAPTAC